MRSRKVTVPKRRNAPGTSYTQNRSKFKLVEVRKASKEKSSKCIPFEITTKH